MSVAQFGFMVKFPCLTNLVFLGEVSKGLEAGHPAEVCCNHLDHKLKVFGVTGGANIWTNAFLTEKTFSIRGGG